jgi:hypothetical protein
VVEHFPSMPKVLDSVPNTAKINKQTKIKPKPKPKKK